MTKKQNKKEAIQEQKPQETKKQAVKEEKKEEPTTILGVTVPIKPTLAADANQEPAYVPKPFEMSRKGALTTQGMPKSKKPWKILSERSAKYKKTNPKNWEQKMEDKKRLQNVRQRVREQVEKKKEGRKKIAERLKLKAKLKEINSMKSATYQIVRNTKRLSFFNID